MNECWIVIPTYDRPLTSASFGRFLPYLDISALLQPTPVFQQVYMSSLNRTLIT